MVQAESPGEVEGLCRGLLDVFSPTSTTSSESSEVSLMLESVLSLTQVSLKSDSFCRAWSQVELLFFSLFKSVEVSLVTSLQKSLCSHQLSWLGQLRAGTLSDYGRPWWLQRRKSGYGHPSAGLNLAMNSSKSLSSKTMKEVI